MIPPPMVERIIGNVSTKVVTKLVQPQHAAACRSMPQHLFFGAAHGGFEACRSMPQHAAASQNFHVADFFFHTKSKL